MELDVFLPDGWDCKLIGYLPRYTQEALRMPANRKTDSPGKFPPKTVIRDATVRDNVAPLWYNVLYFRF